MSIFSRLRTKLEALYNHGDDYSALESGKPTPFRKTLCTRRLGRVIIMGGIVSALLFLLFYRHSKWKTHIEEETLSTLPPPPSLSSPLPTSPLPPSLPPSLPSYEKYYNVEKNLPQHNDSLPFPEGRYAKFIYFTNHPIGAGYGNALQDSILNAELAYRLKRSYVFDNYVWETNSEYSMYNDHPIPSRIPWSATLSGPLVGGSLGPNSSEIPRAVTLDYFRQVCPKPTQFYPDSHKDKLSEVNGAETMDYWVSKLGEIEDRCLEIHSAPIFDIWLFGSSRILHLWPTLSKSPIITRLGWSLNILTGFVENLHIFNPSAFETSAASLRRRYLSSPPILEGLLTIHLRRGDYEEHCSRLSKWSSTYMGFNSFDSLPDRFTAGGNYGENTPEKDVLYRTHCYPEIPLIVERIREIKNHRVESGGNPLKRIYIMTNGKREWLDGLKRALREAFPGEWDLIATSKDLKLNDEQLYVAQSLDMYVALRSQMFIGNGFSSLTSNIVMFRMANNIDPLDTRFW